MVRVVTEVETEIDLEDFDTDDLIAEVESRGYSVMNEKDYNDEKSSMENIINDLYRSFVADSPESFKKEIKKFFEEQLGVLVN